MRPSVTAKTLRDGRQSMVWWSAGIVGLVTMMVAVYPSVRDNANMQKLVENYPEALKAFIAFGGGVDYASAAGYLGSELFSLMIPLLLIVAAIGAGARAIAGEEEKGTLDLLLANPVSRRRILLEKLAALVAELAVFTLVLWAALAIGGAVAALHIAVGNLAAASLDAMLLALLFGSLALLVGGATGRRGLAIAVAAAGAVAAYLLNALAAIVPALDPVRALSPFYHYGAGDPLRHGLSIGHAAVIVVAAAVCALLAAPAFARRDLA